MDVICDFMISGYEVTHWVPSSLIPQQNENSYLVTRCARKTCFTYVPWLSSNALDLYFSEKMVGGPSDQYVVILRIPICELGVISSPQQLTHYEILTSISRGDARLPRCLHCRRGIIASHNLCLSVTVLSQRIFAERYVA